MKFNKSNKFNLASQSKLKVLGSEISKRIDTLQSLISTKIKTINGLILRNKGRALIGLILKLVRGVRPRASKSVVRQVSAFSFRCYRISKHSGLKGLVLYLKASQVLLQQSVGGYRVVDLSELKVRPKRNRSGVPLIIPAGVRTLISQKRDIPSIKLWMTLLGLYRILEFKGTLSLKTITDTGQDISSFLPVWRDFVKNHFKPNLLNLLEFPKLGAPRLFPVLKSGPISRMDPSNKFETSFTNSSAKALILAARAHLVMGGNEKLQSSLKLIASMLPRSSSFMGRLQSIAMACHKELDLFLPPEIRSLPLGKLGLKPEPAGKIRVFAMVDAWTQWLLSPVHEFLFKILRQIPQDGTFDQMSPIERLQAQYSSSLKGQLSSIDLSAATDRLPIELQVIILEVLLEDYVPDSSAFARAWADLLTERHYVLYPDPRETEYLINKSEFTSTTVEGKIRLSAKVKYAVGQPMGALSSWAMLAITHHAMMQFASYKCGGDSWFKDYAVLGDDGVIKGSNQSSAYLNLLKVIGVKAGLAKSILAKNRFVIEFAKKFFVDQSQANMLPFKECIATWASTSLVNEFVRKYDLSLNATLSFLGFGYKVKSKVYQTLYFKLGTRIRVLLIWLSHPNSALGHSDWLRWVLQCSWSEIFVPSDYVLSKVADKLEELVNKKLTKISNSYELYLQSIENVDQRFDSIYPIEIISSSSSTIDGPPRKSILPWRAVLSPELDDSDVDYDYLSAWNDGGMSVHGYRFAQLKKLKLGVEVKDIMDEFDNHRDNPLRYLAEQFLSGHNRVEDSAMKIDTLCRYYFDLDNLQALIPKVFWNEDREEERPFRDFLSVYKFWQEITKPIWAAHYSGNLLEEAPRKDLHPFQVIDSWDIWDEPAKQTVRGEAEGSVQCIAPSESSKGLWWVEFILGSCSMFFILQWFPWSEAQSIPPFVYDIVSYPSELLDWSFIQEDQLVYWPLVSLVTGGSLLLWVLVASVSKGVFTDPLGDLLASYLVQAPQVPIQPVLQLDTVMVGTMRLSGPISSNSLRLIQVYLENEALLENLAISPIGALWELPIA
jgi:hypothetical protein